MTPRFGVAGDYEDIPVRAGGAEWSTTWCPPAVVPSGTRHGANAFCQTADDCVVLISNDGRRWGWPGGRPEGTESWQETLYREVLEETCARVIDARLLGFCRSVCSSGPEKGKVLVRSIWWTRVELLTWEPRHEIPYRRVIPARDVLDYLWMDSGFEPIYQRALLEAGLHPDAAPPRE
jgi:ADP-ribose pyrophosphatase YjhB (NUDIX family)